MIELRALRDDEVAELDDFLARHPCSSMYLRSALRTAVNRAGFAIVRENGKIVGAAAQAASGMVVLQASVRHGELVMTILGNTGRRLAGFLAPIDQVQAVRRDLGLDGLPFLKDTEEDLLALPLAELRVPAALERQQLRCRIALDADVDLLVAWRALFRQEALNEAPGERLTDTSRADIAALLPARSLFILESDAPLACCSFNARLPEMVQVGNVWTPPEARGLGYGRAVVAGALAIAAASGVESAVLSTGRHNLAALAAYRSIGFTLAGDYATATISPDTVLPF